MISWDYNAKNEQATPLCIWRGTWQERNCTAPACPKHSPATADLYPQLAHERGAVKP